MSFLTFFDCSGCGRISYYDCKGTNVIKKNGNIYHHVRPSQCISCVKCLNNDCNDKVRVATQQRIQNIVRVPTSQYLDNLSSLSVRGDGVNNKPLSINNFVNQSQASDRAKFSVQKQIANPRLRPGRLGPGGVGVDVKHNSFNRILARKKAENIRTDSTNFTAKVPLMGNKIKTYGIVNQNQCRCSYNFSV